MKIKFNTTKMAVFTLTSALCFGLIVQARALLVNDENGSALAQMGIVSDSSVENITMPTLDKPNLSSASRNDLIYTAEELQQAAEFFSKDRLFSFERWEGKVEWASANIKKIHAVTEEDWRLIYPIEKTAGSVVDGGYTMSRSVPFDAKINFLKEHVGRIRIFIHTRQNKKLKSYEIRNPSQLVNLYKNIVADSDIGMTVSSGKGSLPVSGNSKTFASESDLIYNDSELQQAELFFSKDGLFSFERWEGEVSYAPFGIKKTNEIINEDFRFIYPMEKKSGSFVDGGYTMSRSVPFDAKMNFLKEHVGLTRFFIHTRQNKKLRSYEIRNPRQLVNLYRAIK